MHFFTHFQSMFLFQKYRPFQRHFLISILAPPLFHTSPNISEIPLHHTTDIRSQLLTCIPNLRKYPTICDKNVSQLLFRVRCWDVFLVLWSLPKVTITSIMESTYTLKIRALRLIFESTHNYSKHLSRKQKFKNLSVCCKFINNELTLNLHIWIATTASVYWLLHHIFIFTIH